MSVVEESMSDMLSTVVRICRALDEDENDAPLHCGKDDVANAAYLFGRVLIVKGWERDHITSHDDVTNVIEDIKGLLLKYTGLRITE